MGAMKVAYLDSMPLYSRNQVLHGSEDRESGRSPVPAYHMAACFASLRRRRRHRKLLTYVKGCPDVRA